MDNWTGVDWIMLLCPVRLVGRLLYVKVKQTLLTEFRGKRVVFLSLKFSAVGNNLTVSFIGDNCERVGALTFVWHWTFSPI